MSKITDEQWRKLSLKACYWTERLNEMLAKGLTRSDEFREAEFMKRVLDKALDIAEGVKDGPLVLEGEAKKQLEKDRKLFKELATPLEKKLIKNNEKNIDLLSRKVLNSL